MPTQPWMIKAAETAHCQRLHRNKILAKKIFSSDKAFTMTICILGEIMFFLHRPTKRFIASLLLFLQVPNYVLLAAAEKRNSVRKTEIEQTNLEIEKPSYFLNLPLSFGAGFLGTMVGITATAIISMPILSISGDCQIKISGHSSGSGGCTEAGYNARNIFLSVGGILGAFVSVHFVSRWLGFRHKWWQTLLGATVGILPFSYYYYHVQRDTINSVPTGGSDNPHLDYGIVSVVLSTMLFTYAGSLYHELADPVSQVELRPTGTAAAPEIYGKLGYRLRF